MNLEKALKIAEEGCDDGHSPCGECVGSCLEGCESEASEIVANAYRDSQTKLAESNKTLVEIEKRMEAAILEGDQKALEWGEHARESQKAARVLEAKLTESEKEVRRLEINCVENHGHLVLDVAAAEQSLREANRRGAAQDKRVEKMLKALENRCPCWSGEPGNTNGHSRDNCHQKKAFNYCRQSDEEITGKRGDDANG